MMTNLFTNISFTSGDASLPKDKSFDEQGNPAAEVFAGLLSAMSVNTPQPQQQIKTTDATLTETTNLIPKISGQEFENVLTMNYQSPVKADVSSLPFVTPNQAQPANNFDDATAKILNTKWFDVRSNDERQSAGQNVVSSSVTNNQSNEISNQPNVINNQPETPDIFQIPVEPLTKEIKNNPGFTIKNELAQSVDGAQALSQKFDSISQTFVQTVSEQKTKGNENPESDFKIYAPVRDAKTVMPDAPQVAPQATELMTDAPDVILMDAGNFAPAVTTETENQPNCFIRIEDMNPVDVPARATDRKDSGAEMKTLQGIIESLTEEIKPVAGNQPAPVIKEAPAKTNIQPEPLAKETAPQAYVQPQPSIKETNPKEATPKAETKPDNFVKNINTLLQTLVGNTNKIRPTVKEIKTVSDSPSNSNPIIKNEKIQADAPSTNITAAKEETTQKDLPTANIPFAAPITKQATRKSEEQVYVTGLEDSSTIDAAQPVKETIGSKQDVIQTDIEDSVKEPKPQIIAEQKTFTKTGEPTKETSTNNSYKTYNTQQTIKEPQPVSSPDKPVVKDGLKLKDAHLENAPIVKEGMTQKNTPLANASPFAAPIKPTRKYNDRLYGNAEPIKWPTQKDPPDETVKPMPAVDDPTVRPTKGGQGGQDETFFQDAPIKTPKPTKYSPVAVDIPVKPKIEPKYDDSVNTIRERDAAVETEKAAVITNVVESTAPPSLLAQSKQFLSDLRKNSKKGFASELGESENENSSDIKTISDKSAPRTVTERIGLTPEQSRIAEDKTQTRKDVPEISFAAVNQSSAEKEENKFSKETSSKLKLDGNDLNVRTESFDSKMEAANFNREALRSDVRKSILTQTTAALVSEVKNLSSHQEVRSLHLRLNPESLGTVDLKVQSDDRGNLSASLTTEHQVAHKALSEGITQLRHELEQAGVQISSLNVNIQQHSNSNANAQHQQNRQESFRNDTAFGLSASDETQPNNQRSDDDDRLFSARA